MHIRAPRAITAALAATAVAFFAPVAWATPSSSPQPTWQTNARVWSIAYSGNVVYLVGDFTEVRPPAADGSSTVVSRNHAAAFDATTGNLLPWDPNTDKRVQAVAVGNDGVVYLGGDFTTVSGQSRRKLAAVDAVTGLPTPWSPNVSAGIRNIVLNGNRSLMYVSGTFTKINGQTRTMVASFDAGASTGTPASPRLTGFAPNVVQIGTTCPPRCPPTVPALLLSPDEGSLYIGGSFARVNGVDRNSAARVDTATGQTTLPWNPNVYTPDGQNQVYAFAAYGNHIFICGNNYRTGGVQSPNLSRVTADTGAVTRPGQVGYISTDGAVNACIVAGGTLYLGGHFEEVGPAIGKANTIQRQHIAAADAGTGAVLAWNPRANSVPGLYSLAADASHLAAGGVFTRIGGQDQQGFAQFVGTP